MLKQAVIAGGGIGGLAAALSASRAGWDVRIFERAPALSEVGAGIQLGPNVVRVLHGWGLAKELAAVASFPAQLVVRSAVDGEVLGRLPLGQRMVSRYGAPYATVHRADLQALLRAAVCEATDTRISLGRTVDGFIQTPQTVSVRSAGHPDIEAEVLVAADGVWSGLRQQVLADGPPRRTGHLAYRALVPQRDLPAGLRSDDVTVWLGARMHVVQYPVQAGRALNVVILVEGRGEGADEAAAWDHAIDAQDLLHLGRMTGGSAPGLRDVLQAVGSGVGWQRWSLHDRPPLTGAQQMASGRVALLGDAAHPMLPYLAQGAGMAIEDADELGRALAQALDPAFDVPTLLQRYALGRWQRNARVQARAARNGEIFHAQGFVRIARDGAMRLLGERLLDMPWLYSGPHASP